MTARPIVPGPQFQQVHTGIFLINRMQNLSSGQPIYIGEAEPGTGSGSASWRIRKYEYDNGNFLPPTAQLFAHKNAEFDNVWDDRATYSYG